MNTYINYITDELKALTSIPSPSGFTKEVTAHVHKVLTDMGYEPYFSNKGNVHVTLGGEGNPLLLAAHLDTLGAMVRSIKENGRLRPTTLGGHQWTTCDGENCTVHTRDGKVYTGVVLNTEPSAHVADEKVERKEANMEILLDENVDTKEAVKALGIQVGDIIAMDPRTTVTESGYIKSRFLDDKLSAAILLGLAKMVKEEPPDHSKPVCHRVRRGHGPGPGQQPAEAFVRTGAAERFYLFHPVRRAGLCGGSPGAVAVLSAAVARVGYCGAGTG